MVKGEFRFSPLTNPLKTTKKGAAAPSLGFTPGAWLVRRDFWIYKTRNRYKFDRPARSSKYSAPISGASCTALRSCATCRAELAEVYPIDFHTSNIYRTAIFQNSLIQCAARRAFLVGCTNGEWDAEPTRFFGAQRYFVLPRLFFAYFFLTSQKKVCRRRHGTQCRCMTHQRCIRMQKRMGRRRHAAMLIAKTIYKIDRIQK